MISQPRRQGTISAHQAKSAKSPSSFTFPNLTAFKTWFESHISLGSKPYTLDLDQARAVFDHHKNTLVTARAGSGKTRVIVAKVAYLIASRQLQIDEIKVFMFNRTAAAEVNERIGAVEIDGLPLKDFCHRKRIQVASTFHKFALDTVKQAGEQPQLISEADHDAIVKRSVRKVLAESERKVSPQEYTETLRLANSFIARAGQKYVSERGLTDLCRDVHDYIAQHQSDDQYSQRIHLHQVCLAAYQEYLLSLNFPQIDFNILMARATRILSDRGQQFTRLARLKYIMVDEYQDFSYLFFNIIQAIRLNCPAAHLFAVGDDWQAINRFAGSDVNYFIDFVKYFPEDTTNIPLMTNYRSDKRIVENANRYMLKNYNPKAKKAVPFSKKSGKIYRINPDKTKFDTSDLYEDALGDAQYLQALAAVCGGAPTQYAAAAQYLKTIFKIIKKHRRAQILLLHRHNFTSFPNVTLENFVAALRNILLAQRILTEAEFDSRIRAMTMHKSKGLESEIVILLELNREQVLSTHPHATIFELFGDTLVAEKVDQHRLLYVALTRAKNRLYIISSDKKPLA